MNCPQCGLINPETAQRCDCGYDFISKSVERPHFGSSPNTAFSKIAIGAQVMALLLAGGAVVWGVAAVLSVVFPGPSGEWAGVYVGLAWVVNLPIGLLALVVGLTVKQGSPGLRRACIAVSLVALSLPILTSVIWNWGRWLLIWKLRR